MESWWVSLEYGKGGDLRFLSHLDVLRLMERALRRSGLPLAWKGKFNPRPRLSAGPALPLGFASEREVLAVALAEPLDPDEVRRRLAPQMPRGAELLAVRRGKRFPSEGGPQAWRLVFREPLPSREALLEALGRLDPLEDARGRVHADPASAVESLRAEGRTLEVVLVPRGGRRLRPDLLARALGLGRPLKIEKLSLSEGRPEQDTKEFHVEKNPDQRSGSGGAPDRGGGERPSPGDPHRQPQP